MIDSEPCQKLVETDITKRTQDETRQTFEDLDEILDDRPHLEYILFRKLFKGK